MKNRCLSIFFIVLSATTRLRDGVPRAFCMPYKCLSDNWMPFSLDFWVLNTLKDPPKTAGAVPGSKRPPTPLAAFLKPLKMDDFQHPFGTIWPPFCLPT